MRYFFLILLFAFANQIQAQRTCGSHAIHQSLMEKDAEYRTKYIAFEEEQNSNQFARAASNEEILIPVVFHVLYNNNNQIANINDNRLREQIEILNQDFKALNSDLSLVPSAFQPLIGNMNVRFVIANRDPSGNVTTGIIRRITSFNTFNVDLEGGVTPAAQPMKFNSSGGSTGWDSRYYLNFWVCPLNGGLLGFATPVSFAGTSGDGVVVDYRYVGRTGATAPFNRGRTATHEVGHWMNLRHIWGDDDNSTNKCSGSDGVNDTPNQENSSSGCPGFPRTDNCSPNPPGIMFMNYMDYSDDACMYMFTKGQVTRMQNVFSASGPRKTFLEKKGYEPQKINDMSTTAIVSPSSSQCSNTFSVRATFTNVGENTVTNYKASYQIDNQPIVELNRNVSLGYFGSETVTFPTVVNLAPGAYSLKVFCSLPNATTDADNSNDTIRLNFTVGSFQPLAVPFTQGFDGNTFPPSNWTINNPDDLITWERTTAASKSGIASVYLNNFDYSDQPYGRKDDLISPIFDLSDAQVAKLSFQIAAAQYSTFTSTNTSWDTLQIFVSTDCGVTGTKIYEKSKQSLVTVLDMDRAFIPTSSQWRLDEVSLGQFLGNSNVQVIFRNICHYENNIYLDDISVVKSAVTGISEISLLDGIEIFPNPTQSLVNIRFQDVPKGLIGIDFINIMGQQVLPRQAITGERNQYQFDLNTQPKGLYLVRFMFEDGTQSAKKVLLK